MATRRSARLSKPAAGGKYSPAANDDDFSPGADKDGFSPGADDDDFSPDKQPKRSKGKRSAKSTTPALPKKRQRPQPKIPAAGSNNPPLIPKSKHVFGPMRITQSPATTHLNRWVDVREKLEVIRVIKPTKIEFQTLKPLHLVKDMPARDFKYDVESADLEINWDPPENDQIRGVH